MSKKAVFTQKLLAWFATNHRPLPWKGERNPYKIWLSEIILQQTTVRQGLPYYERFVEKYPAIQNLADAPADDVMKLWEGLGYYSRARNLHATAKHIAYNLNASFPNSYEGLLTLKGVGSYTAAAIASFAFDLPHAVIDGNVYRVLSRYFGIETPIDMPKAKKQFTDIGLTKWIIDPGFGFSKTKAENFELVKSLGQLKALDLPILLGVSRKSSIYKTLGVDAEGALNGTTVLNTIGLMGGANILRVHDVKEAKEAILLINEMNA